MTATVPGKDVVRRRELAAFLRSRRERITPEQVGLPVGGRRRTPGLRREEVAQLAGVGVTWYTWLEQGRDISPSEQVLDAIAATLHLDPIERTHLYTLAGAAEPLVERHCKAISDPLRMMLRQLEPFPASIQNARTDVLDFNRTYDLLNGMSRRPYEDRNILWLAFTDPEFRRSLVDWDDTGPRMVAQFRAAMASHIGEPSWKHLVKRLRARSPEFDAMWSQHEISSPENMTKQFLHPVVGLLRLDFTHLWLGPRSEMVLKSYSPADAETAEKLATLHSLARKEPGLSQFCGTRAWRAQSGPCSECRTRCVERTECGIHCTSQRPKRITSHTSTQSPAEQTGEEIGVGSAIGHGNSQKNLSSVRLPSSSTRIAPPFDHTSSR